MVIDTTIFIQFLRSKNKANTIFYKLPEKIKYSISTVTLFELFIGATDDEKKNEINLLVQNFTILHFNDEIAIKAADIYRQLKKENKLIEFRDIFIAATCIVYHLPLVTLNTKHFERINELVLG